jgi:hypothetical protein
MNVPTDQATHEIHFYTEPRKWAVRHFKVRSGDSPLRHFFIVYDGDKMYDQERTYAFQGHYTYALLVDMVSECLGNGFGSVVVEQLNELMETTNE